MSEESTPAEVLDELLARVTVLEDQQGRLMKALSWAANEVRPIYGMGYLGKVFDEVVKRVKAAE